MPNMEEEMRKNRMHIFVLLLVLSLSVSCSRIGAPSDDAIGTDIKAKMFSEPALKSAAVEVSSKGGEVTLTGQVPDDAARLAAYKIASQAKGVTKVNDQMSVVTAQAAPEPVAPVYTPAPAPAAKPARKPKPAAKSVNNAEGAPAAAAAPASQSAAPAPPPPQPVTVTVPANSTVTIRTLAAIGSSTNHAGEVFKASLDAPIVVDSRVIVPAGADAYVKLVSASSAGHIAGRSELSLELASFVFQGKTYNVVSSDVKQSGASRGKRSAATIGGGAALGALIGAVAGGAKGAAIGAAVGGGAGTSGQGLTKGQPVKIPSETRLDFTLQQPLDITYFPGKKTRARSNPDQLPTDPNLSNPPSN